MNEIAIIGAGLSGLTLAHKLSAVAKITIFEKSRGVGGRMSNRRAEPYNFDHGAQYFTARTPQFQEFLAPHLAAGTIERWNAKHVQIDDTKIIKQSNWQDDEPRFVAQPHMSTLAKTIAQEYDVRLETRAAKLEQPDKWNLKSEDGEELGQFDWVISTMPPPQATQFFPKQTSFYDQLEKAQMRPCFAVMIGLDEAIAFDFEAAHISNSDIAWIAINSSKPKRSNSDNIGKTSIVIHSSEDFALDYLESDRLEVANHLTHIASKTLGHDLCSAPLIQVHRWLYANTASRQSFPVAIDTDLKLGACGDWAQGGRIEGAFISAHKLADTILEQLG